MVKIDCLWEKRPIITIIIPESRPIRQFLTIERVDLRQIKLCSISKLLLIEYFMYEYQAKIDWIISTAIHFSHQEL